jgi:ubiquitin conjugation factor E4 B
VNYFRTIPFGRITPRIILTDEATLGSDDNMDEYRSQITKVEDDQSHFISEIFFLNSYARWIGLGPVMQVHSQLKRDLTELFCELQLSNTTRRVENPSELSLETLKSSYTALQEAMMSVMAIDCILCNSLDQKDTLEFLGFVVNWLLRLVDERHEHPSKTILLHLQEDISIKWRSLPQFLIEIITDYFIYMMEYSPTRINQLNCRCAPITNDLSTQPEFVMFALTFIGPSGSQYFQNPHLKAKLSELLYLGTLKYSPLKDGFFSKTLNENPFSWEWTIPNVMAFYIGQS